MAEKGQNQSCSVFISGLPYTANEDDVRNFFSEVGEIQEIKLPKYQDTGRLLGYGHVTFSSNEEREQVENKSLVIIKALNLNGEKIGERYIEVKLAKGENSNKFNPRNQNSEPSAKIFVKNLPYDVTEDEVGDFFRSCGPIESVRFVYNQAKNHFKGFGYVLFKNIDSAKKSIEFNGKDFKGRTLVVDYEHGDARQGFRYKTNDDGNSKYNSEAKQIIKKKIKKEKNLAQPFNKDFKSSRNKNDNFKGGKKRF